MKKGGVKRMMQYSRIGTKTALRKVEKVLRLKDSDWKLGGTMLERYIGSSWGGGGWGSRYHLCLIVYPD